MSGYHRISSLKTCLTSLKGLKTISQLSNSLGRKIEAACSRKQSLKEIKQIKELNQFLSKTVANHHLKESSAFYALSDRAPTNNTKVPKVRHVKKEVDKLLQLISNNKFNRHTVLAATGLSITADGAANVAAFELRNSVTSFYVNHPDYFVIKTGKYAHDGHPIIVDSADAIPEPPAVPDLAAEALANLNALGEPTFESLGLGGWTPVGIVQSCMEYLHVTLGLDWWLAIVLGTLIIRICVFPLVIIAQRNAAKMNNVMPQMQSLQLKMTEARQTGDALGAARYSQEMMMFMKVKGVNPLKNMVVPLAQAPIFISFFMGLRKMANVPVESLRHGGIFWFEDLTMPDQFFLLPVITSLTLWMTVELGTDGIKASNQNAILIKYGLRALPLIIFPFTVNFPGVILCYWVSSNFISLGQVAFLRIPSVREYFRIDPIMKFSPEQLPTSSKGFKEGIKDSWTNLKITRELEERRKLDEMQFKRAGRGPVQKTFKYDPTKQAQTQSAAISAKKR